MKRSRIQGAPEVSDSNAPAVPPRELLFGTRNHVAALLACILDHLDTAGLGAVSRVSIAHRALVVRHASALQHLHVYRQVDDGHPRLLDLSMHGLRVALAHARRLRSVSASPRDLPFDDTLDIRRPPTMPTLPRALSSLCALLGALVARNASTLERVAAPDWLYELDTLTAMAGCPHLSVFQMPDWIEDAPRRQACEQIVLGNRSRLETLRIIGVRTDVAEFAMTRLPLTDLTLYARTLAPDFALLAACATLRRLCVDFDSVDGPAANWRGYCEAFAVGLPHLTRLEHLRIAPGREGGLANLTGVCWRLAPSVRELSLDRGRSTPTIVGAKVDSVALESCRLSELAGMAAHLPELATCLIVSTIRDADPGRFRTAVAGGQFAKLRRARLRGRGDLGGRSALGGETLLTVARGCPLLEALEAQVFRTFNVDHLEYILGNAANLRSLELEFSAHADSSTAQSCCISGRSSAESAPIICARLEVLQVPVLSDALLARLACPRLRTLCAVGRHIALTRWPAFPTLVCLRVRLNRDRAAAGTMLDPPPAGGWPNLVELGLGWSDSRDVCEPSLFAALGIFRHIKRLRVYVGEVGGYVLDALASPECPASAVSQLVIMSKPMAGNFAEDADLAALAVKHRKLATVLAPFQFSEDDLDIGQFAHLGIALVDMVRTTDEALGRLLAPIV